MPRRQERVSIPGTEVSLLPDSQLVGPCNPDERIEVTVVLRARPSRKRRPSVRELGTQLSQDRHYLSPEQLEATSGASPQDIAKIKAFARRFGLDIITADAARRSVVLSGTIAAFEAAFGVTLNNYQSPAGLHRSYAGVVHVPAGIAPLVVGVFGLDDQPQVKHR